MMTYGLMALLSFCVLSIAYVYSFRGEVRYANFSEYLRKGWPIFTPLNTFLYIFTQKRASKPIMSIQDFPELAAIQENWVDIRDEVTELYKAGYFDSTKKEGSAAYYDLGFRTFYKYGWSKFYVTWYGYTHPSALKLCPKTVKVLNNTKSVNGAMFSLLPPGSQLTRHLDPLACSLRYHLGLSTPNSDKAFINIDGKVKSWRDGEAFMFDETFVHYAKNNTDQPRLILMCDIDRPTHSLGWLFNLFYKNLAKLTVVPNMEGDKQGLVNSLFSGLSPIIASVKKLKQTNKPLYLVIKYTVNLSLALILLGLFYAAFYAVNYLLNL